MISKSDLVILVIASGALMVGISRWHQNTQDVSAITIPASASNLSSSSSTSSSTNSSTSSPVASEPVQSGTTPIAPVVQTAEDVHNAPVNTSIQTDANGQIVVKSITQPKPVVGIVVEADSTIAPNLGTHQVQAGENLSKIADQYGTDVQTLRDLNNISGSVIQIGQQILYPL